ncbi:hypothetical protein D0Z07_3342 [Hyphodiscus hymeniophilus]|uniref:Methyltransferase domain-containing protein n=1 Tax=Hyphodiscus hymeniophilus TaxID=353542 RepID=A0A9P7AYY6_9HELO|nr:hypothetical protein D0Z07_3342 [Hyphodiscus hymeniophilus]
MALRVGQLCGLWFWVAAIFFVFVILNQSRNILSTSALQQTTETPPSRGLGLTTRQRMARSESSWHSSVSLRHQMAKEHPENPQIPLFPAQKMDDFGKYPYTIWDFFPATYTCPHDIQRIGRLGDGGKWVCGMSLYEAKPPPAVPQQKPSPHPDTIIYSFGVNDESTFEAEMLARIPSAQVYAFDYSVTSFGPQLSPSYSARAHFNQFGLGFMDEPTKKPPFFTLSTLMAQNNHTYIDILKIDIEGSEYEAFDEFMDRCDATGVMPVGQVMIELHLMDDKHVNFSRFTKWWERLEAFGMRPTWLEINLLAVTLGEGPREPPKAKPRVVQHWHWL